MAKAELTAMQTLYRITGPDGEELTTADLASKSHDVEVMDVEIRDLHVIVYMRLKRPASEGVPTDVAAELNAGLDRFRRYMSDGGYG
jgi:hypothetical protein